MGVFTLFGLVVAIMIACALVVIFPRASWAVYRSAVQARRIGVAERAANVPPEQRIQRRFFNELFGQPYSNAVVGNQVLPFDVRKPVIGRHG